MKLLIATRNPHKVEEIKRIFNIEGLELLSALDIEDLPEIEETGHTFAENAILKAAGCAQATGLWALADDSGIEVDALDGAPGIYSARYAGPDATDKDNNLKLLEDMRGKHDRGAQFTCAIALSDPTGEARTVQASCRGTLLHEEDGAGGFGYDPLFQPEGYTVSFGQFKADDKHRISHRGKALKQAEETWGPVLKSLSACWPK